MTKDRSPISRKFVELHRKNEAALIVYATAGYPTLPESLRRISEIGRAGADMIEIGVPFSDPIADGPVIQQASQTAIRGGITLEKIIAGVRVLAKPVPVILMSYLNPILAYGKEIFMRDIGSAGVSGLVVPDLPVEESAMLSGPARNYGVDLILIVAPTSPVCKIKRITRASRGFVYCASVSGTTGVRKKLPPDLAGYIRRVRQQTRKPLCVGFGLSTANQIKVLAGFADGVIVGSRFVEAVRKREDIRKLVAAFKAATRRDKPC
jgi:tryptophan synthase alpha chain